MGRVVVESPNGADANDAAADDHAELHSAPIDGDSVHVQRLGAIRHLHAQLQRFWNAHEPAVCRIWNAMSVERRQDVYQIIKPEQGGDAAHPYLVINGHKIPVEATNLALIPELSPESVLGNLLHLFDAWALPPIDIVAWESLKYVRFCISSGKIAPRSDHDDGFAFVLGERFGQCAAMKDDADAKDRFAMERCMRRGAICTMAEFSLVEDRLLSVLLALAAVANEFGQALVTAAATVQFQPVDLSPDPSYVSITGGSDS